MPKVGDGEFRLEGGGGRGVGRPAGGEESEVDIGCDLPAIEDGVAFWIRTPRGPRHLLPAARGDDGGVVRHRGARWGWRCRQRRSAGGSPGRGSGRLFRMCSPVFPRGGRRPNGGRGQEKRDQEQEKGKNTEARGG